MNSNQAQKLLNEATKNIANAQAEYLSTVDSGDDTGLTFAMTLAVIAQTQALIVIANHLEAGVKVYNMNP